MCAHLERHGGVPLRAQVAADGADPGVCFLEVAPQCVHLQARFVLLIAERDQNGQRRRTANETLQRAAPHVDSQAGTVAAPSTVHLVR